ncbi:hypothetical protein GJ633_15320, partial [Halorubrum sp. CBA1125]|nr:hypothetical protein [Halorubrum sp. CBA1125]
MSLADTSTFTRRLEDLGVTVTEGPERDCAALVDAAATDRAAGADRFAVARTIAERLGAH